MDRAQFLKAARQIKRVREVVELPEFGEGTTIIVQELSAADRDSFEEELTTIKDGKRVQNFENFRARLIVKAIVNEDGTRVFQDEDSGEVGRMPAAIADRIFSAAQRVSGMTGEDLKEIRKNCEPTTGDVSSSE